MDPQIMKKKTIVLHVANTNLYWLQAAKNPWYHTKPYSNSKSSTHAPSSFLVILKIG